MRRRKIEPLCENEMRAWMLGNREEYSRAIVDGLRLRLCVGWGQKRERAFYTVTHGGNLKYEGYSRVQAVDCFNEIAR